MKEFEKLGAFYLGKEYDLHTRKINDNYLLYNSKDLVTHAVCIGMTGSGKTGLGVTLLEEAAIDGIPSIVIDPKGDLTNLFLTFPEMKAEDFRPWINESEAQKKGLSPDEYASAQAELWRKGIGEWGQDPARIEQMRQRTEFALYTPGSSAGTPVSILRSFSCPTPEILEDGDLLRERINATTTSLLNMLGIESDPIQSREHILLSTIFHQAWQGDSDLDMAGLIQLIQTPPIDRIGVFDLESFYPSNDRFALAMRLNNLLAAPGFSSWLEGEPLDIGKFLYTDSGRPKLSIFSIAHLNDQERMFIISLLLTELLSWIRTQSGTSSLRALLYIDEIFGYLPPVATPPSKEPLLTLLKQARAFGLGVVLSTQNPVDLDYKALSNAGTWFLGRLQTERDKKRVIEGLEGAASSTGGRFDRQQMEQTLAGLGKRVFLMNNVHEDQPVLFHTRWALSYLPGPLTRNQIKQLKKGLPKASTGEMSTDAHVAHGPATHVETTGGKVSSRVALPPEVEQKFISVRVFPKAKATLVYQPALIGMGDIYYVDAKVGIATERSVTSLLELPTQSALIDWDHASIVDIDVDDLEKIPEDDASYRNPPPGVTSKKSIRSWPQLFKNWLYREQHLSLMTSPTFKLVSKPNETERDFRIRMELSAHELRDKLLDKARSQFAPKLDRLESQLARAEQLLEKEELQVKSQKVDAALSIGATMLSAFFGRKSLSRSTLSRAQSSARGASRIVKEMKDVEHAREKRECILTKLTELQEVMTTEIQEIKQRTDPLTEQLDTYTLRPKKSNISVNLVSLAWVPYWKEEDGTITPAWGTVLNPAGS